LNIGKAIKNGIVKASAEAAVVNDAVSKIAPTVEAVSELIVPGSGRIEALAMDAFGAVVHGVKSAGDAASANGVSVTLDAQLIADIKAILPAVEAFLHPAATSAPPAK
jgi:hypothetical protein